MLKSIEVVFDGNAFIPTEPVDLPSGTKLNLAVPVDSTGTNMQVTNQLRAMTEEEKQRWEQLCRHWETAPPDFLTVDEALAYSRGRLWPELLLAPDSANQPELVKDGKDGNS
jgi:predicted DNA-binding antitoxin AbrB/MazE fold protein